MRDFVQFYCRDKPNSNCRCCRLVFSQSIESLTLIKRMLHYMDSHDLWFADGHEAVKSANETWGWVEGRDYMVSQSDVLYVVCHI